MKSTDQEEGLQKALQFLGTAEGAMVTLLETMVCTQSGTWNKAGVDRVGRIVEDFFSDLPLSCRRISEKELGDNLVFTSRAAEKEGVRHILVSGHMDTVFPEDTSFNWFRQEGDRVYGPGVIDMKGGLVVTMYAVRALAQAGLLEQLPLVLLFNSDEEIGSPSSLPLIEELCRNACCALVTECGGLNGKVVTGRRGKTGYRLDVFGQAGHAAFAGTDKASAVLELSRLVVALERLNNPATCRVVNVGLIKGGIGPNTVADKAMALIDTRFCSPQEGRELEATIRDLAASCSTPGTRAEIGVTNRRPVMEQSAENQHLFTIIQQQAERLGLQIVADVRQGVSDASNIAGHGVPVVDGLGPIGEYDHSDREYMQKDTLLQRTRLMASSLVAAARAYS